MEKLKLKAIPDDKPVKLTIELPAATHRDLLAYAKAMGQETSQPITDPARLIAPMLTRFMATDRAFTKMRRLAPQSAARQHSTSNQKNSPANTEELEIKS